MNILITGNAGSGKSSVATELKHRDYDALDADEGFGHWIHKNSGEICSSRPSANRGDYYWVWSTDKIKQFLKTTKSDTVFFCGLASNQAEVYKDFDKIVMLNCDFKVIKQRLSNRQNNPFGKRPDDLDWVRKTQGSILNKLPRAKVIEIDAAQPLQKVVNDILSYTHEN
jgi:dephospho-CoA kinase